MSLITKSIQEFLKDVGQYAIGNKNYNNNNNNNVEIKCCNGSFSIHPLVLAAISPWLKEVLESVVDSSDCSIIVPEINAEDMKELFKLLFKQSVKFKDVRRRLIAFKQISSLLSIPFPPLSSIQDISSSNSSSDSDNHLQSLSDVDIPSLSNETIDENFTDQYARLVCLVCYKLFSSTDHQLYKEHVQGHTSRALKKVLFRSIHTSPVTCSTCNQSYQGRTAFLSHACEFKRLACLECQKTFVDMRGYTAHFKSHKEKCHQCRNCKKLFSSLNRLNIHQAKKVCWEKSNRCEICYRTFVDCTRLKIHMRLHNGEQPFQCEICQKRFTQKRSLTEHMLLHSSTKFSCELCDKRFTQKNHLKYHSASVHGLGTKLSCSICSKMFAFPFQLRKHEITHQNQNL